MNIDQGISRRQVLGMSIAAGSMILSTGGVTAQSILRRTPTQILGPFYPVLKPLDQDADLTLIAGRSARASGQVIHVMGQVMNRNRQAVADARIEIWQADAHGRYTHVSDRRSAPPDPNFGGYARLTTDAQGRYRFKTIKPGAYPEESGAMRTPHIHFDVTGKTNRLVTQLYFAGERLNDGDRHLQSAGANQGQLIASLQAPASELESDSLLVVWDIVLDEG